MAAENCRNNLTAKQRKAIAALLDGHNLEKSALAAGVNVRTLYRWHELPEFTDELRKQQARAASSHVAALSGELARNRQVLTAARDDELAPWHVRIKAAQVLEDSLLRWRDATEFEARLQALEAAQSATQ